MRRRDLNLVLASGLGLLAGCAAPPASVALDPALARQGLSLVRALPDVLPDGAVPVPHAQFMLNPAESAAGLLVPIPFVSEAVGAALDRRAAEAFEARYAGIAPYRIALAEMNRSAVYRAEGGALTLKPFVFMTECVDDRYRLALVFHLQGASWVGRYMAHLPTAYPVPEFKQPSAALLATLQGELVAAAADLRALVERAARGELRGQGEKADVGSLHLVGGRAAGLVSPTLVVAQGGELIDEDGQRVVVRLSGDMSHAASAGGLFYGVHLLRRDQLHTFRKHP